MYKMPVDSAAPAAPAAPTALESSPQLVSPQLVSPQLVSNEVVGKFGQGEYKYNPIRDALVGASTGLSAVSSYYFLTQISKNQDLKEAVIAFRQKISDLQISLDKNPDISSEKKNIIGRYLIDLRPSVTYDFANLTYPERTGELKTIRNTLEAIKTALADKLPNENITMMNAFAGIESLSNAASRMKIGQEALIVGAVTGLAAGLMSNFASSVRNAIVAVSDSNLTLMADPAKIKS